MAHPPCSPGWPLHSPSWASCPATCRVPTNAPVPSCSTVGEHRVRAAAPQREPSPRAGLGQSFPDTVNCQAPLWGPGALTCQSQSSLPRKPPSKLFLLCCVVHTHRHSRLTSKHPHPFLPGPAEQPHLTPVHAGAAPYSLVRSTAAERQKARSSCLQAIFGGAEAPFGNHRAERVLQTLEPAARSSRLCQGYQEGGKQETWIPLGGCGRGLSCGFHWLLLLEHWRWFWRPAELHRSRACRRAPAETVLKWPFQVPHPRSCCWNAQPKSQDSKDFERDPGICFRGGGSSSPGG